MDKSTLAKKATLLHLNSLALADGMRNGSFRSLYKGRGIDFSGVREYMDGDDVRTIDWNVTARMCRPFVKQYDEEKDLNVMVVIDASASMKSGSGRKSRLEIAAECASLLTLASFHNASPIGAVIYDGKIRFNCSPAPGHDQVMLLLSEFEKVEEYGTGGSSLESALLGCQRLLKKRTLIMVFSDFRTTAWGQAFGYLCQRNDVVAVKIADSMDEHLPEVGSIPFTDPETGIRMVLPTSSSKFRRKWREDNESRMVQWNHECRRRGGIPFVLSTNSDCLREMTRFFSTRDRQSI